jgi:hypothetical protein
MFDLAMLIAFSGLAGAQLTVATQTGSGWLSFVTIVAMGSNVASRVWAARRRS